MNEIIDRLLSLLTRATEGRIVAPRGDTGPDSIRKTGIDSLGMLNFLLAVEDEFGIEWGDDAPEGILNSFEAMAHYIGRELGLVA
jgi:acyl carrier protein